MKLNLLLTIVFVFFFSFIYSQEREITGTVTDAETGDALIGVTVLIQGTGSGTVTDIDGQFAVDADLGKSQGCGSAAGATSFCGQTKLRFIPAREVIHLLEEHNLRGRCAL